MNPRIAQRRRFKAAHVQNEGDNSTQIGHHAINVGDQERQWSMIGGTALAVFGLTRRSVTGAMLALIGGALIWRGHTGHCEVYHALGHSTAGRSWQPEQSHLDEGEPTEAG
jgi:uncharacterized membrane protein